MEENQFVCGVFLLYNLPSKRNRTFASSDTEVIIANDGDVVVVVVVNE